MRAGGENELVALSFHVASQVVHDIRSISTILFPFSGKFVLPGTQHSVFFKKKEPPSQSITTFHRRVEQYINKERNNQLK